MGEKVLEIKNLSFAYKDGDKIKITYKDEKVKVLK